MKLATFLSVATAFVRPATSGEFVLQGPMDTNVIQFSGSVEVGDLKEFEDISAKLSEAIVTLSSPGGNLAEGLKIGDAIRHKGYKTKVVGGAMCASACGYMWLAGRERVVEGDGKVGFHAAYKANSDYTVSASGNAVAGAYMARLGLNDFVITYATEAAPREMRWLTPGDAKFIGLDVSWVSPSIVTASPYVMTRAEIHKLGLETPFLSAFNKRFPENYDEIIDVVYEAQARGENWERAALAEFGKSTSVGEKLISTSRDALLVELAGVDLRYLNYLEKHNPALCASGYSEIFPYDQVKLTTNMPANIKDARISVISKMLTEPTTRPRHLSKSDIKYFKRKILAIIHNIISKSSNKERAEIKNIDKNHDSRLACKFVIALHQAVSADIKLLSISLRASGNMLKN